MAEENEVTVGELGRRFDAFREDFRDDMNNMRGDIKALASTIETKTVGVDLYKVRHSALEDRMAISERHLDRIDDQIEAARASRRYIWVSLAVGLFALVGSAISGIVVALIH